MFNVKPYFIFKNNFNMENNTLNNRKPQTANRKRSEERRVGKEC